MWRLDLICCGRGDTHVVRETWTEADEFRRSWTGEDGTSTGGHDRQAILVEDFCHVGPCNGYAKDCPLPGGSFLVGR
jgi:hypothetical protein